jgi:hypothetical protein
MRSFRVLALSVVVVLFVAAPNVFARVCHPKKPVTCNATTLSRLATGSSAKASTSVKSKSPVKVQHAMLCGPWVHWRCAGAGLI